MRNLFLHYAEMHLILSKDNENRVENAKLVSALCRDASYCRKQSMLTDK